MDKPREMVLNPFLMRNIANTLPGYPLKDYNSSYEMNGVTYNLNNYGYRGDDFPDKISPDDFVFAGCSFTYGQGVPIEYSWPSILNQKANKKNLYNLSLTGKSFFAIIYDTFNFIEKFGSPEAVFMFLPNIERFSRVIMKNYSDDRYGIDYVSLADAKSPEIMGKKVINNKQQLDAVLNVLSPEMMTYYFVNLVKFFEAYCKAKNIKLYWTTWCRRLSQSIRSAGIDIFDNYFELGEFDEYAKENIIPPKSLGEYKHLWLQAADRPFPHPGIMEHGFFAKRFFEEFGGK